jgi:hypothetical protein
LIQIKSPAALIATMAQHRRRLVMTVQSILVLAGIVSAFLFFGISLAWADFYTQRGRKLMIGQQHDPRETGPQQNSIEERRAA